ncbi:MAG: hypothetical protein ACTSVV_04910 [Promethearchaeota archaeon]
MIFTYRTFDDPLSFIDIGLWCFAIFTLFFIHTYTMYRITLYKGDATELQRRNAFTWAIAFMLLGLANLINLIWRYTIESHFHRVVLDNFATLFVNLAVFIKILHTEYTINRYEFYKGYYFSIATSCQSIFTFIVTPEAIREVFMLQTIYLILLTAGTLIFPGIFLYLAIRLKGEERRKAIIILIGVLFFSIGLLFQPHNIEPFLKEYNIMFADSIYNLFLILCPIFTFLATIVIFSSYIRAL